MAVAGGACSGDAVVGASRAAFVLAEPGARFFPGFGREADFWGAVCLVAFAGFRPGAFRLLRMAAFAALDEPFAFAAFRASRYFLILAFETPLCSAQTIPNIGAAGFLQPGTGQN